MTVPDRSADGLVGIALQSCLAMLTADCSQDAVASAEFLVHLTPSQKHLALLQRHLQVRPETTCTDTC